VLLRDRSRPAQIVIGGVIPAVIGAIAGVLIGVSSAAYWVVAVLTGVGAFVAGFEHRDGWGGADRGGSRGRRTRLRCLGQGSSGRARKIPRFLDEISPAIAKPAADHQQAATVKRSLTLSLCRP